jgi:hypothetical protein
VARQWYGSESYHRRRVKVFRREMIFDVIVIGALGALGAWILVLVMVDPRAVTAIGYGRRRKESSTSD